MIAVMTWKWLMLIQASYDYFLPLFPKIYFSCEKPRPRPGQAQAKLSLRDLAWLIDLQSLSSTKPSPTQGFEAKPGLNNTSLNQFQREELALIEQAYDNPHECWQSDLSNSSNGFLE